MPSTDVVIDDVAGTIAYSQWIKRGIWLVNRDYLDYDDADQTWNYLSARGIDTLRQTVESCVNNSLLHDMCVHDRAAIKEVVCDFMQNLQRDQAIQSHGVAIPAVVGYSVKTNKYHTTCVFLLEGGGVHEHKHKFLGRRLARVHGKRTWKHLMVCDIKIQPIMPVSHVSVKFVIKDHYGN